MPLRSHGLAINQFAVHNFLRSVANAVRSLDPFHLICGLKLLGNALALRHLPDQQLQHGIGLLVELSQVASELTFGGQLRIDMPLSALQIGCMRSAETANPQVGLTAHLLA